MALTKIPAGFQQSIIASSINTFGRAVEELVYNSIDAGASSVAVRVSVKNYFIQVIDNGAGVNQKDLESIGKIYMTSKFENRQNREPSYYGFRGQSISTIVKVAHVVKISSRCDGSKETWSKEFISGIEQDIKKIEQRPSKGTTVEIKGLFYNAVIRRKAIEEINELNNIKSILEKIAVVNTNLSLSLRNNSNMEILLTIHKNRDIIQTLGLLNGIDINKLKELQVEKNQYKVKAYIVCDEVSEVKYKYNWIYLNKLFLKNRKLQNTFDGFLKKYRRFRSLENKQSKLKEETGNLLNKKTIPSYFIFISCPYNEYDISRSPKQSFIEFKNWDNLTKILEKLAKFYIGDLKMEDNQNVKAIKDSIVDKEDTRSQVRKIIERVLGNKSKNTKNTRMQNGVTGKYVKRKQKKLKYSNKKGKKFEVQNKDNIFLLNEKPCTRISPTIICKTKDMAPHCAADMQNCKAISKEIEQHAFNLSHLKESLKKVNSLNFQEEFRENCAALKRKCDELEIKVDRMLMRPKTKKLKKSLYTISNSKASNIEYTNISRNNTNIISRKTFKSTTLFEHNINERSPYFPTNISREIESSSPSSLCAHQPFIKYEWKVPNIASKTLHLPLVGSANYQSHQEYSLDTFQSHCFNLRSENDIQNIRKFISKQSIDNFGLKQNALSKIYTNKIRKDTRYSFIPKNNNINMDLRATASSYTIEFSKTNDLKNCEPKFISKRRQNTFTNNQHLLYNNNKERERYFAKNNEFRDPSSTAQKQKFISDSDLGDSNEKSCSLRTHNLLTNYPLDYQTRNVRNPNCQNTEDFMLPSTSIPSTFNYHKTIQTICTSNTYQTYENISDEYGLAEKNDSLIVCKEADNKTGSTQLMFQTSDVNVVFVSESKRQHISLSQNVNPFEICEVLLADTDCSPTKGKRNNDIQPFSYISRQSSGVKGSYTCIHNSDLDNTLIQLFDGLSLSNSFDHGSLVPFNLTEELKNNNEKTNTMSINDIQVPEIENEGLSYFINDFVIKDRQRFLPKGMSPLNDCIAQHSKCASPFDKEYFDPIIYFNFLDNLQTHSKIYEPDVQNMKTIGTKEIQNFQEKVIKDNASLVFTGKALGKANIFGQVDNKFIAASIEGNSNQSRETAKFLVLFDQHAIHERIRLENNLLDYLEDDNWKSVDIDDITLKLTKDEILYVHNYKEKFEKFGLKWTSKNNFEIRVTGIPTAVLGKNLRQEDKVMMAVKQIILEIIKSLQTQRGCVPLYLKTIMDLVFSEACRYAIKFGDKLTIDECKELLLDLSHCKTPFQCAHGRPVMAVLMELKNNLMKEYSINKNKLLDFLKKVKEVESRKF